VEATDRLANPEPAGRDERLEHLGYAESLDTIDVELLGFVVERHQRVTRVARERPRDVDRFLIGDALSAHEVGKFFAREISLRVEDGDVEIFVERNAALFPF